MLLWSEHPGLLKSRKKCISPNPCTKIDINYLACLRPRIA